MQSLCRGYADISLSWLQMSCEVLWQEVKTVPALSVLQYSCSARTMALHTGELNARR